MPHNSFVSTRETRQLIKGTSAAMRGKSRGQDRQVRRDSYDINDPRAQVFSRIADGTVAGGLGWADDLLKLAKEFDVVHKKPGARGPLQANGIRVLEVLLYKCLNFKTGTLEPALAAIGMMSGLSRNAIVGALKRLKQHGFLSWVRRSQKTDGAGEFGPQREQVTNAYFFDMRMLPKGVLQRFRDLRERRRRRRESAAKIGAPPPTLSGFPAIRAPQDPALAKLLADLGSSIGNASSQ
ncbi:hypothetical protein [Sphingomonas sp. LT1P40]|uniref:hypothetical protein n=1 Tax=Alteristakelama amylovorans TaxID=3096166 RepID=UPI002FCB1802